MMPSNKFMLKRLWEKALRESHIRNVHELGEMKRAQELRVDELPA